MLEELWPLAGTVFMGQPAWVWCGFMALVVGLLAFDLRVLNRHDHTIGFLESLRTTALYVLIALLFGAGVWVYMGADAGMLYLTAFLVEKSLSLDNVFVISTVFAAFAVPSRYQHRVLLWGIIGAISMRGVMIALGTALVARFHWVLYIFAALLFLSGIKALLHKSDTEDQDGTSWLVSVVRHLIPMTPDCHGHAFWVRVPAAKGLRWMATPLLPALVVVELADAVFAIDSIPAVLSITNDTFIVFSSNIFAILGLRALYSVLAVMVGRFAYLRYGLAGVLMFIGVKIVWSSLVAPVPAAVSLSVTVILLGGSVALSWLRPPCRHGV